jgi:hypothetical protein
MNLGLRYHKLSRESGKEGVFQITYIQVVLARLWVKFHYLLLHAVMLVVFRSSLVKGWLFAPRGLVAIASRIKEQMPRSTQKAFAQSDATTYGGLGMSGW